MKERFDPSRREFTLASALAVLSGVTITITGCGGGGYGGTNSDPYGPSTPAPTPMVGDKLGAVSANHGHEAMITAARLTAGQAISLDIRGQADHTHNVELSAVEINAIAANQQVTKPSSSSSTGGIYGDHLHSVSFN
jgi:hypothetical protein